MTVAKADQHEVIESAKADRRLLQRSKLVLQPQTTQNETSTFATALAAEALSEAMGTKERRRGRKKGQQQQQLQPREH